jgi:uncharacterized SAM-dependent methyltransferase
MGYSKESCQRYIRVRLKVALSILFETEDGKRRIDLEKNDTILLWRSWHYKDVDVIKLLDDNNFNVLQASQTDNLEYLLTVARVKSH